MDDTSYYSTNYAGIFSMNSENYLIGIDSSGKEKMFFDFKTDLNSYQTSMLCLNDNKIMISGLFQDSIFRIGDFELYNPEPIQRVTIFHGLYYFARKEYNYFASFSLSPTTGIIQRQHTSLPSKLYPNPSNNIIKIKFEQALSSNAELIVFSIDGKLITKQNYPSGTSEIQLDVSSYPKGVYLAGVQSGEERVVHKFLKN